MKREAIDANVRPPILVAQLRQTILDLSEVVAMLLSEYPLLHSGSEARHRMECVDRALADIARVLSD